MEDKITITFDLEVDHIRDLFVTAIEGGSNHWLDLVEIRDENGDDVSYLYPKLFNRDFDFFLTYLDQESDLTGEEKTVYGRTPFYRAYGRWVQWKTDRCGLSSRHDFDANDADVFMQYALLGDIVYG